ncbi:hypothetical protein [Pseudozobellia thermophila]|uniref:Uncharacterized protein n=1 Tax=Pseudozobellia thermophila TaxID=192903 RepID=A0A1M6PL09_9FLAO|nr:hypothetical protein [Pseudozobellia thermophila]SHK08565.1 hypothetical protein SAMN04488513_1253 [Pseudozobellia thermophila]
MKHIIILLLLCTVSCRPQDKNNVQSKNNSMEKKKEITPIMYGLAFNSYLPFEVYLDDIPVKKWYRNSLNTFIDLNPYLLGNGEHTIKVVLLPDTGQEDMLIEPKDMVMNKLKLVRFEKQTVPGMSRAKNYTELRSFDFPKLDAPVPRLEQEWDIDITDLPYELEGWRNSQDLRLMDSKELEKKVVGFYENLIELLDKGEVDTYMNMLSKFYDETDTVEYLSKKESQQEKDEIRQELINESKGYMQPLTNYSVFIYANGRLVTLERTDTKNLGEPALRTKKPNGEEVFYYTYLHLPNDSNEFEIIR